jgi:hypothetical protein
MTTLTTNRFLTTVLRTLCCTGALTVCSAWATVVTWQLNPSVGTTDLPQSAYTASALGVDNTPANTSRAFLFETAAEATSETKATKAADVQSSSKPASESAMFAAFASDAPARPATELDQAMAGNFDEEFVSMPTVQFASAAASVAAAASEISIASRPSTDPAPVPEMSALFPIVGLIAAVSCTQILRRRRVAQQNASRSVA